MKLRAKNRATALRKKGLSYKEILREVKISKSTLSVWLRDIELTQEQIKRLTNKMDRVRYVVAKRKVAARVERTKKIVDAARIEARLLIKNPLFISGTSLYWAEGAKNSTESVKFANSDEKMILLAMRWLREVCEVPEKKFRIHIHIHDLHSRHKVNNYWSKITGIPLGQFYKPYIKPSSLGHRKNILYNGTCSITVGDKALFRRIMGWKMGLQEYFNIPS